MCRRMGSVRHRRNPDAVVAAELQQAGIPIVAGTNPHPACPLRIQGRLATPWGQVAFDRRCHYWSATGPVPLDVARALYYDAGIDRRQIRAGGHRPALPPERFAVPDLVDQGALRDLHRLGFLMKYCADVDEAAAEWNPEVDPWESLDWHTWPALAQVADLCDAGEVGGTRFVGTYHLDSQEALILFAAVLRSQSSQVDLPAKAGK